MLLKLLNDTSMLCTLTYGVSRWKECSGRRRVELSGSCVKRRRRMIGWCGPRMTRESIGMSFLTARRRAEAGVRGVEGEICESVLYVLMIGTSRGDCNLGRMRLRMTDPVSMRLIGTRPAVVVVLPLEFSIGVFRREWPG
jgi:hypothetical protein